MKKCMYIITLLTITSAAFAMEERRPFIIEMISFGRGPIPDFNPTPTIQCLVETQLISSNQTSVNIQSYWVESQNPQTVTIGDIRTKLAQEGILPRTTFLYVGHPGGTGEKCEIAPDHTRLCDIESQYGRAILTPFLLGSTPTVYRGPIVLTQHSLGQVSPDALERLNSR